MTSPSTGSDRRTEVVHTALELLDESGFEAVTLRAVARKLDVRLNTVSWSVKTKARLQDLMADAILAEVDLTGLPDDWRARIEELARRYRAALLAHRDGARVVAGTMVNEAATLAVAEAMVSALLAGGLPEYSAGWTVWTLVYFTLGLTQEAQGLVAANTAGHAARIQDDSQYPALQRVLPYMLDQEFDARFNFGLRLILDGAAATVGEPNPGGGIPKAGFHRINPDTLAAPVKDRYKHVVVGTGSRLIAIAGQVALDADGGLVGPGDHARQAKQAFTNLRLALAAAGATPEDMVRYTVYVSGHSDAIRPAIAAAAQHALGPAATSAAVTLVGVQTLSDPAWLVEVDALALLP